MKAVESELGNRIVCGEFDEEMAFATDGKLKYIYYKRGGAEHLFNQQEDPYNIKNLINDTNYESEKKKLKAALINYLEGFGRLMIEDGMFVCETALLDIKQ